MALITRSQQPIIAPPTNALPVKASLLPAFMVQSAKRYLAYTSAFSNFQYATGQVYRWVPTHVGIS